jgi:HPr kinase/phosphorylase
VFGVGLLLLGKSGIGKSECALELVLRGHRLVADDVVQCDWRPPGLVFGAPANLLRHHIETRGLGVLNVKALFGVTSVRDRKCIDVVVRLVEWDDMAEYDRLGVVDTYHTILGTPIRELTVPVRPGRDMGSILEVAARNELLRRTGAHPALEFLGKLEGQLMPSPDRTVGPTMPSPGGAVDPDAEVNPSDLAGRDSVVPSPDPDEEKRAHAIPSVRPNESSAWIPAMRTTTKGGA